MSDDVYYFQGADLRIKTADDRRIHLGRPGGGRVLLFVEPKPLSDETKTPGEDGKFPNQNVPVVLDRDAAFQLIGYLAAFVVTETPKP